MADGFPGGVAARFREVLTTTLYLVRKKYPKVARTIEETSGIRKNLPVLDIVRARDQELGHALGKVVADPTAAITGPQVEAASGGRVEASKFSPRLQAAIGLNKRALVTLASVAGCGSAPAPELYHGIEPAHWFPGLALLAFSSH